MVAAQRRHRGDVDERVPARPRHTVHLRDGRPFVLFVKCVKNVEACHEIEDTARERHGGRRRAHETPPATFASDL